MFRNYLGFAGQGFYLRCRLLGFQNFYSLVQGLGFWILWNGMVEYFLVILVNGLGNCDRTNAWLPTYPLNKRIRSSRSSCIMMVFFFLIYLNFCLGHPFRFSTQQALSFFFSFFFTLLFRRPPFQVFNLPFLFFFFGCSSFCLDCPFGFLAQQALFIFYFFQLNLGKEIT